EFVAEFPVNFDVGKLDVSQISDCLPEFVAGIPVNFDVGRLDVNQINDVFSEFVAKIQTEFDIEIKIDTSQLNDIQSISFPRVTSDYETSEYIVRSDFPRYYAENSNSTTVENLNITLENGFRLSSDYDTEKFINAVAERLQTRQIRIRRGTGGVQF
ncbi:MAG: hypothetical protein K2G36_08300, partial [Ruminococcus sp.]|nr:hypothetical protein [Ruminococcus sp.]